MRRLLLAILFVVGLSGAPTGKTAARPLRRPTAGATARANRSARAVHRSVGTNGYAWMPPALAALVSAPRQAAQSSAAHGHAGLLAGATASASAHAARDLEATGRSASWPVVSRGYRATGPPGIAGYSITIHSSALPA